MEHSSTRTLISVLALGGLLVLPALIPARWFGLQGQSQSSHTVLDLAAIKRAESLPLDNNTNGVPDWKDMLARTGFINEEGATISKDEQAKLDDPNNLTASYAKNAVVISSYLQDNNITSPEVLNGLMQKALVDEASKITVTTYTAEDLAVAETETPASIRVYGNTLGKAFLTFLNTSKSYDELSALKTYQETKDIRALDVITKKEDALRALQKTLTTMPVPLSASTYHVTTVNRVGAVIGILENFKKIASDPLRASIALNQYPETVGRALSTAEHLGEYFDAQNIVFTSKESGYVFTSGILK